MGLCSGESCHRIQVMRGSCMYRFSYVHICTMSLHVHAGSDSVYSARIAIEYVDDVLYIDNNRDMRLYTSRL